MNAVSRPDFALWGWRDDNAFYLAASDQLDQASLAVEIETMADDIRINPGGIGPTRVPRSKTTLSVIARRFVIATGRDYAECFTVIMREWAERGRFVEPHGLDLVTPAIERRRG